MSETKRELNITPEEIEQGKTMAILCYIGFLVFIPMFMDDMKKNKYVMFHAEQGIICLILSFFCGIGIIFAIIGIINAVGGKVQELPLVGQFGEKINLVK
jgi:uncharacterized membrane protein